MHFKYITLVVVALGQLFLGQVNGQESNKMKFAIAIHGGAGPNPLTYTRESIHSRRRSLQQALQIGTRILKDGGNSLDAVEQVVRFLEDDPQFNAGVGAVFNSVGSHELDASIMDGRDLSCGAVAGVSTVKNPISLARQVKEKTRHVLFAGNGAETFAKQMGVELVEPKYFDTEQTLRRFKEIRATIGKQGPGRKTLL